MPPMPPAILRQKLVPPASWPDAVDRPRTTAWLDAAIAAGQHGFLVAGSGFGKTTVLAMWARQREVAGLATAWLALDAEDADLDAFLAYVLAALELALPGFASAARGLLPHARDREGAGAALDALLVDLDEQLDRPLVLILDDYHLPASPSLDALLVRLLRYLPPLARLVLASRRQPTLELAELRAKRRLAWLDEAGLAFDMVELRRAEPALDEAAATARLHATGGWPAAVGLAPELADAYLEEAVLGEAPRASQALLERLALVEAFDAAYPPAIPGAALDAATRDALLHQRLIVARGAGRWAVPQPLGRLLRERFLREAPPDERRAVLGAVAAHQWAQAQPLTALATWVSAGDTSGAARHLAQVAESWLAAGRLEALANGLAALPTHDVPALWLAEGELGRRWADVARAERCCSRAIEGFDAAGDLAGVARARLRLAMLHAARGETERARGLLAEAAPDLGEADHVDRLVLQGGLALFGGQASEAIAHYEAALAVARARGDRPAEARALHNMGVCWTRLGDDARALASYDAGLALAEDGIPAVWMTPINRALALIYLERPQDAGAAATAVLERVRALGLGREEGYALRILGYAQLERGDLVAAEASFEAAAGLASRLRDPLAAAMTANFQAEAASLAGDHGLARARLGEVDGLLAHRPEREGLPEFARTRARVLLAAGDPGAARAVVEALLARARAGGYRRLLAEAETLAARLPVAVKPVPGRRATGPLPLLAPPEVEIRCFGGFHVDRAGAPLPADAWQSFRAKLLLAYLVHTPEGASKERLFDVLFPNEHATEAAVNMTLMRLRKALEPGLEKGQFSRFIMRSGGSYLFNRQAAVRLDTQDFEHALRAAKGAPEAEERHWLDSALALYRGDFLPEFDQAWVLALRQRLRGRALEACRQRLALVPDADVTGAQDLIHRALAIDPLADDFHRELILRYLEREEPQRAREHYALVQRRYREALGSEPPADLAALVAAL